MYIILYVTLQLLRIIEIAIIARCILSFIPPLRSGKIAGLINWLTEPVLSPVRKLLDKFTASDSLPIDITPIAAYFALIILRMALVSIMNSI